MSAAIDYLAPGTPCYLVNCVDEPSLNGKAVTIEFGPIQFPDEPGVDYYSYVASWTDSGIATCAMRRCLRPIVLDANAERRATHLARSEQQVKH